jgi:hypothetical protein
MRVSFTDICQMVREKHQKSKISRGNKFGLMK